MNQNSFKNKDKLLDNLTLPIVFLDMLLDGKYGFLSHTQSEKIVKIKENVLDAVTLIKS